MFFQTNPIITISFNGEANRPKKVVKLSNKNDTDELLIYGGQENVTGHVDIMIPPGKKIEHLGVKIEMYYHYYYYFYYYYYYYSYSYYYYYYYYYYYSSSSSYYYYYYYYYYHYSY